VSTNGAKYRVIATNSEGTATSQPATLSVRGPMTASPAALHYVARKQGATLTTVTPPQLVTLTFTGAAGAWTAASDQPWLTLTGAQGTGAATFTAAVGNPSDVLGNLETATATITVTSPGAPNSPRVVPVTLTIDRDAESPAPIGAFDTPIDQSTVSGSIAVTGWALDDVGVNRVEIWRDRITNDPAPPFLENGHPANGKVFIANGTFVEGTRPDIESLYTSYPARHRAGWGYLMLTYGLPNANGTFVLTAIGWDQDGQHTVLGTKTISVNNATATKPFGSIDVPAYGATFSGPNWTYGWALTPAGGCTVSGGQQYMTIDSAPPNFPISFGANRTDIASAFPGFADSNAAGGAVVLDSRNYTNGTHQIGWLVYDSCGNGEGIGSRFFTILNNSGDARLSSDATATAGVILGKGPAFARVGRPAPDAAPPLDPLWLVRGMGTAETLIESGAKVWLSQTGRIEVHATRAGASPPADARYEAYLVTDGHLRSLPLGSSFDPVRGTFYWQPVAGFLGSFDLRIMQTRAGAADVSWTVPLVISPNVEHTLLQVDTASGALEGWSLDPLSSDGAGIGRVHVWARRLDSAEQAPFFLGAATLGLTRTDVGDAYGRQFDRAGFALAFPPLGPGHYEVIVYAWSLRSGRWETARAINLRVR
jgi:hypothetical protein